jgi:hypothetical protein
VAARSCARARRAVGEFACKHASARSLASAMRCIAATRHGSPLRGTLNPTENGLTKGPRLLFQANLGLSVYFRVPPERRASVSGDGEEAPVRGWGAGLAADGELVHQAAVNATPKAVADGSSPSRLPWSRVAPTQNLPTKRSSALRATTEADGGAGLRRRAAGRVRICVQARIRPWPRLCDALHRRHPTRKPASRDTESHGKCLTVSQLLNHQAILGLSVYFRVPPERRASVSAGSGGDATHR